MSGAAAALTLAVEHITRYDYGSPVESAHHLTYLHPVDDALQRVVGYDLSIDPTPAHHRTEVDTFGNARVCFSLDSPHSHLEVAMRSRVEVRPRMVALEALHAATQSSDELAWENVRDRLAFHAAAPFEPVSEFSFASPFVPLHAELRAYARVSFRPGRPLPGAAIELMQRIHRDFRYEPASTEVSTPVLEAFEHRRGVCQDFAHVMIGCLRSLGLAARYVSGYLLTQPRPGEARLVGADASHAWLAVWCPLPSGNVWLELDPTNDCAADTRHVRLAYGRDYGDVTPLRGVIRGGGQHTLEVRVTTSVEA